jgi:hypothetical protein
MRPAKPDIAAFSNRPTWLRWTAACALALLFGTPQPAHANKFYRLERPTFGCAHKRDIENLVRLATELPRGLLKNEAIREYASAHCKQLFRGAAMTIVRSDGGYVCVRDWQVNCLWIPQEAVKETYLDDGVF